VTNLWVEDGLPPTSTNDRRWRCFSVTLVWCTTVYTVRTLPSIYLTQQSRDATHLHCIENETYTVQHATETCQTTNGSRLLNIYGSTCIVELESKTDEKVSSVKVITDEDGTLSHWRSAVPGSKHVWAAHIHSMPNFTPQTNSQS